MKTAAQPTTGTAEKKMPYSIYLGLSVSALVFPILVVYVIVCLATASGVMTHTLESTLPGTAAITAQAVENAPSGTNAMQDILNTVAVSKNTLVSVVDADGKLVASNDAASAATSVQTALAASAGSGESAAVTVKQDGEKYTIALASVKGSDGQRVLVAAPAGDFSAQLGSTRLLLLGLTVFFIFFGLWGIRRAVEFVAEPLRACYLRLDTMSDGDFHSEMPKVETHCLEVQAIYDYMEKMRLNTHEVIADIDYTLGEMANRNFTVDSRVPEHYLGDYSNVLDAERRIKDQLTQVITEIREVSEQVSAGSEQVSNGAQTLAQGATEQASSVETLSATVGEIAGQITESAAEADKARSLTLESGAIIDSSAEAMAQVSTAMDEISETSRNIGKVIKAIDDIAFQTNILALNAAVEAARAGSAGKGFAVVADEVRNLSQKSAEAAKNTTALIESSIEAVEKGGSLVSRASEDFKQVAEKSGAVNAIVGQLAEQFRQQAEAANQISLNIEQVSNVVQMNSATSEESAAASEELSSKANMLRELAVQFRLGDGKAAE